MPEPDPVQDTATLPDEPDKAPPPTNKVLKIQGDENPPVLIHSVEPRYTKSARKKGLSGTVVVELTVDAEGMPQDVRLGKGLGTELDEIALENVRQYRFKPATKDGHPVPVKLYVQVNFQIKHDDEPQAGPDA